MYLQKCQNIALNVREWASIQTEQLSFKSTSDEIQRLQIYIFYDLQE